MAELPSQPEATDPTRVLYGVSMLQDACLTYLAAAVPYRLETLPYDVTDTHLTFDGYQLLAVARTC